MINTLIEPYSDVYLSSWIVTTFLYQTSRDETLNLEKIQAGLRYFLNQQRKMGNTALLNELPDDFLKFIESDTPTLDAYEAAVPAWEAFVQQRCCPDSDKNLDLDSIYTFFRLPFQTFSHPVAQRAYGALGIWAAGCIGTAIAADKHALDQGILIAITLGTMALVAAYWYHISKDRVTDPVKAMKHAPLTTTCEFNRVNAVSSYGGWSRFWPADHSAARKELERHVGGTPSLLKV